MMTPKEYVYTKRQESGYFFKFGQFNQSQLKEYLEYLPIEKDKLIAQQVWEERQGKTLSEIWDETTDQYKQNLLIGLIDVEFLKKIVDETYLGVLPTGDVNAFASFAPNGERMIILNEGLLHTIHYWSSFFLRTYEEGNDDFFWKDTKVREDSLKWIYLVWRNKLSLEQPVPDMFPKTKDGWNLAQVLTFSAIVFVIAHEIGHVFHNHSQYSNDKNINHKMEFDADLIALETTFKYAFYRGITIFPFDVYYTKFMMAGPYLVMNILALFGINDSQTHPSIIERINFINHNYKRLAKEYLGEKKFELFISGLDDEKDFFERLQTIGTQQLVRHISYSEEMEKLKEKWV